MTIEYLKHNLSEAKKLITEIRRTKKNISYLNLKDRADYSRALNSLFVKLKILNDSIPDILLDISGVLKLSTLDEPVPAPPKRSNISVISYKSQDTNKKSVVALRNEDKEKFIRELSISDSNLKSNVKKGITSEIAQPSKYVEISNRVFGRFSDKICQGRFGDLKDDLMRSNSPFLLTSYISIMLFSSLLIFLGALIIFGIFVFLFPSSLMFFWIPLIISFISVVFFYLTPSVSKSGVSKEITSELPFATIYMAAIASSNVEPTKIFKILSNSKEYPTISLEMRKVLNQVEIYGYDLVTSLRSVAHSTPNLKLADLLNGLATNIVSGGSLKSFLEKKSETLLNDYRLERERYNSVAATFMDVYISILITAPLILVMLIVVMGITGMGLGMSVESMVLLSVGIVVIVNLIFLMFLQIRQPKV